MQRYHLPELQDMLDGITSARTAYLEKCKEVNATPNPERLRLLDIMDATADLIQHLKLSYAYDELELREMCLSAYLFCVEQISAEYRLLNPEFSQGYIYNSGSKLYKILIDKLITTFNISDTNKLNEEENLIYVSNFYHEGFNKYKNIFANKLEERNCDPILVEKNVKGTLLSLSYYVVDMVNRLLKSIPVEASMNHKMENMPEDYLERIKKINEASYYFTKEVNAEKKLIARIAAAISELKPIDHYERDKKNFLTENQRIKMGFLLSVMQTIYDEYYVKGNVEKSITYCLCREALNITHIEDMDPAIRLECLSAYKAYINKDETIKNIEDEVNNNLDLDETAYQIHSVMGKLTDRASTMIDELRKTASSSAGFSNFTLAMGLIGALMLAVPGYSIGQALGFAATQTSTAVLPKFALDTYLTGPLMTMLFNNNGSHLSFFAANLIVDASIMRGFTKAFEAIGMVTGGVAGVGIAEVLNGLTAPSENAAQDINLAKSADSKLVDCLVNLPSGIFTKEEKEKIKVITGNKDVLFHHEKNERKGFNYSSDEEVYHSYDILSKSR